MEVICLLLNSYCVCVCVCVCVCECVCVLYFIFWKPVSEKQNKINYRGLISPSSAVSTIAFVLYHNCDLISQEAFKAFLQIYNY